jgi:hypothetical protein
MRQTLFGTLLVLILSVQSIAAAQDSASSLSAEPASGRTLTGVVTAATSSYILVSRVLGTKTYNYRFIIRPATKINGTIVKGAQVVVIYRKVQRPHRARRNMASSITVIMQKPIAR